MVKKNIYHIDVTEKTTTDKLVFPFRVIPNKCSRVFYRDDTLCRYCIHFGYCKNKADVDACMSCNIVFDPDLLICKTCPRVGICKSNTKNSLFLSEG